MAQSRTGAFDTDLAFLQQHTKVIVLTDSAGSARVVIAPEYQGRVMTSTTGGPDAPSFGWIGREAIASGKRQPHMNVFGGEDRFWLGPEGGFYELETSSPALSLKPGQSYTHVHRTFHFTGPEPELDAIARAALKVGLADVKAAFR